MAANRTGKWLEVKSTDTADRADFTSHKIDVCIKH